MKVVGLAHEVNRAGEAENMEISNSESSVGRRCQLRKPVRDRQGRNRFNEQPLIIREVNNLGRDMLLVQFDDGSTTFLFPDEVIVQ